MSSLASSQSGSAAGASVALADGESLSLVTGLLAADVPNVVVAACVSQGDTAAAAALKPLRVAFAASGFAASGRGFGDDAAASSDDDDDEQVAEDGADAKGRTNTKFSNKATRPPAAWTAPGRLVAAFYGTAGGDASSAATVWMQRADTGAVVWAAQLPSPPPASVDPSQAAAAAAASQGVAPTPARRGTKGSAKSAAAATPTPVAAAVDFAAAAADASSAVPYFFLPTPETLLVAQGGDVFLARRADIPPRSRTANQKFREYVAAAKPIDSSGVDGTVVAFAALPAAAGGGVSVGDGSSSSSSSASMVLCLVERGAGALVLKLLRLGSDAATCAWLPGDVAVNGVSASPSEAASGRDGQQQPPSGCSLSAGVVGTTSGPQPQLLVVAVTAGGRATLLVCPAAAASAAFAATAAGTPPQASASAKKSKSAQAAAPPPAAATSAVLEQYALDTPFAATLCCLASDEGVVFVSGVTAGAAAAPATVDASVSKAKSAAKKKAAALDLSHASQAEGGASDTRRTCFQYFTLVPNAPSEVSPETTAAPAAKGKAKKGAAAAAASQAEVASAPLPLVALLPSGVVTLPPRRAPFGIDSTRLSNDTLGARHLLLVSDASAKTLFGFVVSVAAGPPPPVVFDQAFAALSTLSATVANGAAATRLDPQDDDSGLAPVRLVHAVSYSAQSQAASMLYPTLASPDTKLAPLPPVPVFQLSCSHRTHASLGKQWHNAGRGFAVLLRAGRVFAAAGTAAASAAAALPFSPDIVDAAVRSVLTSSEVEQLFVAAVARVEAQQGCDPGAAAIALLVVGQVETLGLDLPRAAVAAFARFLVASRALGHAMLRCSARISAVVANATTAAADTHRHASVGFATSSEANGGSLVSLARRYPSTQWVTTLHAACDGAAAAAASALRPGDVGAQALEMLQRAGYQPLMAVGGGEASSGSSLALYEATLLQVSAAPQKK